jgi:hypothetical protein
MTVGSRRHRRRWSLVFLLMLVMAVAALHAPAIGAQEPQDPPSATPTPTPSPTLTPTPAPVPAAAGGAAVFGAGTTTLGDGFPADGRGDMIFVALHVRTLPDQSIGGVFTVTQRRPNGELRADVRGRITCLRVEGPYAIVTGVIASAATPGLPDAKLREGFMAGVIVQEGGGERDRIAWTFGETVPNCSDLSVAMLAPIEYGNFVVRKE